MVKGLFVTTAPLSDSHGGGKVSQHELNAFSRVCDKVDKFTGEDIPHDLGNQPFLYDFTLSMKINDKYDIAFFNGHSFYKTISTLRYYNPKCKIVTTVPAHNLEDSIEAHHKLGIKYEELYPHMVGNNFIEYTRQDAVADLVIYPSKYSMDYFSKRVGLTNKQVIIPHGCDGVDKIPTYPSPLMFGYIGEVGLDKGVFYLIDAFFKMKDARLTLFGRGSKYLQWQDVIPNVTKYGEFKNLDEIMPKFNVGVFPSVTEGFNINALECFSYGRPIIISDGAGFSEYVQDGVNGFVVPKRDSGAIVEKVEWFMDHPKSIREMGKKAYRFSKHMLWKDVEDEYVKQLREVLR